MSSDFSPELRKELLDDFYAECDELLTSVRQSLSALEQSLGSGEPAASVVEALFRGVHSLKGIAAIAGVRPAELLAHGMEDLLRALSQRDVSLNVERLDVLLDATQRLEEIIRAHQAGKPAPDHEAALKTLRTAGRAKGKGAKKERETPAVFASASAAAKPDAVADPLAEAQARGLKLWRCTFAPTAALDQRGVNVNCVRERLGQIGEILKAAPTVQPNASIVFVFTVGFREEPEDLAAWEADGIRFEPIVMEVEPSAAAPIPAAAPGVAEQKDALSLMPSHMVRVDLARLDELMRITGEMVIQRSRLEDRIEQQCGGHESLKEIDQGLARSLREMRKAIARVRLVPIAEIFTRMPFVLRDLSTGSGKKARVALEGHQTEIDKYLAERLKEPLLHLVRNAFSHGIETPAERATAGKPEE
ncbi:MAG TPA: Hpt domain-containing protein, partial [Opitutus sp.]|nr:Hpt domain-containing protein [Opitutus sp.]